MHYNKMILTDTDMYLERALSEQGVYNQQMYLMFYFDRIDVLLGLSR